MILKRIFGMAPKYSPYDIQGLPAILDPEVSTSKVYFSKKIQLTKEAFIYRFNFSESEKVLGTKVGECIQLTATTNGQQISRYYSPISRIDDLGFVDFCIQHQLSNEKTAFKGGEFTKILTSLQVNDVLDLSGPFGSFTYLGYGNFLLTEAKKHKKARRVGLLATGSGVASFFQFLEAVSSSANDNLDVSMVYNCPTIGDCLLLEEILSFHDANKIQVNVQLEQAPDFWQGLRGEFNEYIIDDYLPKPSPETLILVCVSPRKSEQMVQLLKKQGYSDDMIHVL